MKRFTPFLLIVLALVGGGAALGAGTVSESRKTSSYGKYDSRKQVEVVTLDWIADAADGSIPATDVKLTGFLLKVITNPGATAPTAAYDIAFGDPEDTTQDALNGALADRNATLTETKQPTLTNVTAPIFLAGTYRLAVTNNSVNSATGRIMLYLVD